MPPVSTVIPAARDVGDEQPSARIAGAGEGTTLAVGELLPAATLKADRLRRDDVLERTALLAGEHRVLIFLARSARGRG